MNQRYKQNSLPLSHRVRLMELFLETARQDPAYLLAELGLDRADRRYRQALAQRTERRPRAISGLWIP